MILEQVTVEEVPKQIHLSLTMDEIRFIVIALGLTPYTPGTMEINLYALLSRIATRDRVIYDQGEQEFFGEP